MAARIDLMSDSPTAAKIAKRFYGLSRVLAESTLPTSLQQLIQLRVAQLNGCGFCVDLHMKEGIEAGESLVRLGLVTAWQHTTVFTGAERAALALADEGTLLGERGVTDETWAAVREHFDDDQIGALVMVVSLINAATRMNVIVHNPGGSYQPGMFDALTA